MVSRHLETAPSLAPTSDAAVYVVLDDFGRFGRACVETDEAESDVDTIVENLLTGQYRKPFRVVAFNVPKGGPVTPQRWSHASPPSAPWPTVERCPMLVALSSRSIPVSRSQPR